MLSLPAAKGFDIGSGFAGTTLRGSQHNDVFLVRLSMKLVSCPRLLVILCDSLCLAACH
jgi:hypothetical protein